MAERTEQKKTGTTTLWRCADDYDLDQASDGLSRYGAYLASHTNRLSEDWPAVEYWVMWCWDVATPPIMSPGYARWSDPVESTTIWRDSWDGSLAATVVVRTALPVDLPPRWLSWRYDLTNRLADPRNEGEMGGGRSAALARVTLEGPFNRGLPVGGVGEPGGTWPGPPGDLGDRRALVAASKVTVDAVVSALSAEFGPAVEALRSGGNVH